VGITEFKGKGKRHKRGRESREVRERREREHAHPYKFAKVGSL